MKRQLSKHTKLTTCPKEDLSVCNVTRTLRRGAKSYFLSSPWWHMAECTNPKLQFMKQLQCYSQISSKRYILIPRSKIFNLETFKYIKTINKKLFCIFSNKIFNFFSFKNWFLKIYVEFQNKTKPWENFTKESILCLFINASHISYIKVY